MLTRRQFTLSVAGTVAAAALPSAALAHISETHVSPFSKPITIIVPMPKQGPTDLLARFIAAPLSKVLGQKIVVDNITGDWGMTGTSIAARAAADGHTLIMGQVATHAALPVLRHTNVVDAFTPVGLLAVSPMVFLTRGGLGVDNLQELKARGSALTIATGGIGSASALAAHKLKLALGVAMEEKVYTGTAAALQDLSLGRVDVLADQMISALPMIRSGKVKAIGMAGTSRHLEMPDVLTGTQQGFAGLRASNWSGLFAPRGLDATTQQRLASAINTMLEDASVARKMREHGLHVPYTEQRGPEQLARLQQREMDEIAAFYGVAV